jgi:cell pole-organizing protein PopZ
MSNAAPQTGEPTMEEILASIRRIISEEEVEGAPAAAAPEAAEPAMTADEGDDILELTNIVPEPAPAPRQRPALVQPADDIDFHAEPEPEPEALDDGLVAAAVVDRAASAFDALHRGIAISETKAGGSLEGLVREMMKPLLKQWLDTNLPDLVERVVREEVERVTNRRR